MQTQVRIVVWVSLWGILSGTASAANSTEPSTKSDATSYSGSGNASFWQPGSGAIFPARSVYANPGGSLEILNVSGSVNTKGHAFFEPLKADGRACVTCHQPSDGMSLSAATAQRRWTETGGHDALFAAFDGSNCPNLPQALRSSHSLLLNKGLIRISRPWPPRDSSGKAIKPEFTIEVVNDPTGCNLDATWGLHSKKPRISVFRRPRPAANLRYVEPLKPLGLWQVRSGEVFDRDPRDGKRLAPNLMADSRVDTLRDQMADAMATHLESHAGLTAQAESQIEGFELQLFAAQITNITGGSLQEGGATLGPDALAQGTPGVLGAFPNQPGFPELEGWRTQRTLAAMTVPPILKQPALPVSRPNEASETASQRAYRDSVARGYDLFMYRPFLIRNVGTLNPLLGNPVKQTCANCHNMQHTGLDNVPGYLGLGTNNYPTATPAPDLPLFKLVCRADAPPHPYLGRTIFAHDPGRALVSGKCSDIGATTAQQLRVLAARAPYFAGGSAATLRDVVEFYDRRFRIGYTEQEIEDLVNFLGAL
jgi:cytochrome c peroxidase